MSEWVWLSCDCTESKFQLKSDFDDHLEERVVICKCLSQLKSTHEWNIHYKTCVGAPVKEPTAFLEYIKTIGEVELKTPKIIIARLFNRVEERSNEEKTIFARLRAIDESLEYEINEGKVIINLVGITRKPRHDRKVKKD